MPFWTLGLLMGSYMIAIGLLLDSYGSFVVTIEILVFDSCGDPIGIIWDSLG
jgi:hypothetical protein